MEIVIDQLNSLGTAEPLSVSQLEANMRDAMLSPMIVMLLRLLTSAEIQRRHDFFAPFIMVRCRGAGWHCFRGEADGSCCCGQGKLGAPLQ